MWFADGNWEIAARTLEKHCTHVLPASAWRWKCALQNGSLLAMDAGLGDGFLHLATWPRAFSQTPPAPEMALRENSRLCGGVRLALDSTSRNLHLRADLPIAGELELGEGLAGAIAGFHSGAVAFDPPQPQPDLPPSGLFGSSAARLVDVMSEVDWPHSQRSDNEFSAELDAESAPPATLRLHEGRIEAAVELVRSNAACGAVATALAVFLLTANSALCFCRACAESARDQEIYRLQSFLGATPAPEEVESVLAALSVAYRLCGRETNVLLNPAAAQAYLSVRKFPHHQSPGNKEE